MRGRVFASLGLLTLMSGCGIYVPKISEPWDRDIPPNDKMLPKDTLSATAQIEFEIKKRIYCDLKQAVSDAEQIFYGKGKVKPKAVPGGLLPLDWGAEVTLSLEVDEAFTLAPGISINQVMPNAIKAFGTGNMVTTPQSFSLGLGANVSSTATRIDKFDSYYTIERLAKPILPESICNPSDPTTDPIVKAGFNPAQSSPFVLESDLGIRDWLIGALYSTRGIPSDPMPSGGASGGGGVGGAGKAAGNQGGGGQSGGKMIPDTMTLEVKFSIVTSGNVTPTWKLVRVSANTGNGQFFNAGRTRLHDLIITVGPSKPETTDSHNTQVVGNTVSNATRTLLAPY